MRKAPNSTSGNISPLRAQTVSRNKLELLTTHQKSPHVSKGDSKRRDSNKVRPSGWNTMRSKQRRKSVANIKFKMQIRNFQGQKSKPLRLIILHHHESMLSFQKFRNFEESKSDFYKRLHIASEKVKHFVKNFGSKEHIHKLTRVKSETKGPKKISNSILKILDVCNERKNKEQTYLKLFEESIHGERLKNLERQNSQLFLRDESKERLEQEGIKTPKKVSKDTKKNLTHIKVLEIKNAEGKNIIYEKEEDSTEMTPLKTDQQRGRNFKDKNSIFFIPHTSNTLKQERRNILPEMAKYQTNLRFTERLTDKINKIGKSTIPIIESLKKAKSTSKMQKINSQFKNSTFNTKYDRSHSTVFSKQKVIPNSESAAQAVKTYSTFAKIDSSTPKNKDADTVSLPFIDEIVDQEDDYMMMMSLRSPKGKSMKIKKEFWKMKKMSQSPFAKILK